MTERQMLELLYAFFLGRNFVEGDTESIRDMVLRYKQPPLTLYHRVCLQMTKTEYKALCDLLTQIGQHLKPVEIIEDSIDVVV